MASALKVRLRLRLRLSLGLGLGLRLRLRLRLSFWEEEADESMLFNSMPCYTILRHATLFYAMLFNSMSPFFPPPFP